jgi:hypothetical protein
MKNFIRAALIVFSFSTLLPRAFYAQTTSIQLPTADSSSSFRVVNSSDVNLLRLNGNAGFYFGGTYGTGVIPTTGSGVRLMWYPAKAAFRAGYISGSQWDDANIGNYSTTMGRSTIASGGSSTATGYTTTASGDCSTAMGRSTIASGSNSTATGYATTASGDYSTAMGHSTIASGNYSTAMGDYAKAKHTGAFIIGDYSDATYDSSSANNQMTMRFAGGYRLYSSSDLSTGVYMNAGISGWTNVCDQNKKENFHAINGEELLMKIRTMPITEWNYEGTDKSVRYIGPVAQDFYSAFHLGGTDSLGINSICIDGVNMAAIQALEKRTAELNNALNELKAQKEKVTLMEKQNTERDKTIADMNNKIEKLSRLVTSENMSENK